MPAIEAELTLQYENIISDFIAKVLSEAKIKGIMVQAGESAVGIANSVTPVRTGNLRSGNMYEVVVSGGEITLRLFNDVEYASYVNYGTSRMEPRSFFDAGIEAAKAVLDTELANM